MQLASRTRAHAAVWTAVILAAGTTLAPGHAHAQKKNAAKATQSSDTLEILGIVSDEVEEQADGLTEALRAQARLVPGVNVGNATQTLDVMTAANRCPQSPDPTCQVEIAKQLKTTQYIWGVLKKAPAQKVTIELHHYVKDKPDHFIEVSYPANLRDQNDESLKKIARRLLVELLQVKTGFVHVVGTGAMAGCAVQVDGKDAGTLRDGNLLYETTPGEHTVTTLAPCPKFAETVTVPASNEVTTTLIEPGARAAVVAPPPAEKKSTMNGRKIAGITMMGVGVAAGAVGVVFLTQYASAVSKGNDIDFSNPLNTSDPNDYCTADGRKADGSRGGEICDYNKQAKRNSTIAWISGGAGLALIAGGAILWATAPSHEEAPKRGQHKPTVRLQPSVGVTNGLWMTGTF